FTIDYNPETEDLQVLNLELWDHDTLSDDDQIGKAEISLADFFNNKHQDKVTFKGVDKLYGQDVGVLTYELEVKNSNQDSTAPPENEIVKKQRAIKQQIIQQQTQNEQKVDDKPIDDNPPRKILINIIGVSDVFPMDSNGQSDRFIKIFAGGEEKAKTTYKHDTL
ncbi:MAG: hypothetical protein EZS28_055918, partial [Streblomastix strix]